MDRRINNKTRVYLQQMKNDIKGVISSSNISNTDANALLQFIISRNIEVGLTP